TADFKTTLQQTQPEVAQTLDISDHTLKLVREGMLKVGTIGFCRSAFADLPVKAAAKTGTSDVVKLIDGKKVEGNNGFLISYAPYEDPEIAVAVVVETADSGSLTAVVAADIYDYYFSPKENAATAQPYGELLV
ncbi:MAG: penicillin-binding transpeptidase domain-containing protein, partial [Acutalibacteraceae bacterium]|nr:penicillin-binding transpeptidase domain-containing protein [Acutalibacteraceae bacterium]